MPAAQIVRPIFDYIVIPVGVPDKEIAQRRVDSTATAAEELEKTIRRLAEEGYSIVANIGAGPDHGPLVVMGRQESVDIRTVDVSIITSAQVGSQLVT